MRVRALTLVSTLTLTSTALAAALPARAQQAPPPPSERPTEEIVVRGQRPAPADVYAVDPSVASPHVADASALLRVVPGADVDGNGPLAGQVQYRGMSGSRVDVRIDGVYVPPGGPNWMDPPLHYAPRVLLDRLEVERGIAPVSAGPETIGGSVRARLKRSRFADGPGLEVQADVEALGRSADRGFAGGGMLGVADDTHRFHVLGSEEFGSDRRTPTGRIDHTGHERRAIGGGYGVRLGDHELGIEFRHLDSNDAGNPSLPLDTRFFDTEIGKLEYSGRFGEVAVEGRFYGDDIEHRMDNFSLRAPPAPAMFRYADAASHGVGYAAEVSFPVWRGRLAVGADGHRASHDMDIFDPNDAAFFVTNFRDVERDRHGGYLEWRGTPLERLELEMGLRYTRVESDARPVDALPAQMMPPPMMLRDRFNASDRERGEDLFDAVVKLSHPLREGLRLELGGGRKTRAPSYIERYAWLPLEVSAGLADGNNYVGHVGLDPEIAYEVEGGFEWNGGWWTVSPRAFYRSVDDYIQGVPATDPTAIMVSTANGDPTPLQFANVDAELFGVDGAWGLRLPGGFQLDGVLSYVRGRRRDVGDDLYRIAPLRGRAALGYRARSWSAAVEGVFAARQNHVSATNGESETGGWGILNLHLAWSPRANLELLLGLDNATNELYRDHLAGFNRVASSGVPVGGRLPGAGRSVFGRARVVW